ncbi:hypothetical protein A9A72_124605 [Stutzerimonas stutzeri]|uniref:Uncharacterized protein n=1 Tax=Stutzerimonas stutzeri TaxID=316 RepID=A0A5S5B4I6_STUST|nr:hypothetical protein A9A72_124605 [Stutzerimonas stutzeri]
MRPVQTDDRYPSLTDRSETPVGKDVSLTTPQNEALTPSV